MIAACPKCSARYRVDAERVGEAGAKLRCTKCSAVFLVRAPKARRETPAPERAAQPHSGSAPSIDRDRLVLVGDPAEERGKRSAGAIGGWGLTPHLVSDGVEAMLALQRMLPRVVVLDAALPRMSGLQICEIVKRNESLRQTRVILVGAPDGRAPSQPDPSDLYGADVYLEQADLPEALGPLLREAGMPLRETEEADSAPRASARLGQPPAVEKPPASVESPPVAPPASVAPAQSAPGASPAAAATGSSGPSEQAADPEREAERAQAERLARIAVSEMILYQPEKFDQANRAGTLEQVLDAEIQEARALLRQRIGEEVRNEKDFVLEELRRVAAERSGQG